MSAGPSSEAWSAEPVGVSKPKRKRITPEQLVYLTELFETTDTPSYEVRDVTGAKLGMTNREVQVWFQNRRAKTNRQRQAAAQSAANDTSNASSAHPNTPSHNPHRQPPPVWPVRGSSLEASGGAHGPHHIYGNPGAYTNPASYGPGAPPNPASYPPHYASGSGARPAVFRGASGDSSSTSSLHSSFRSEPYGSPHATHTSAMRDRESLYNSPDMAVDSAAYNVPSNGFRLRSNTNGSGDAMTIALDRAPLASRAAPATARGPPGASTSHFVGSDGLTRLPPLDFSQKPRRLPANPLFSRSAETIPITLDTSLTLPPLRGIHSQPSRHRSTSSPNYPRISQPAITGPGRDASSPPYHSRSDSADSGSAREREEAYTLVEMGRSSSDAGAHRNRRGEDLEDTEMEDGERQERSKHPFRVEQGDTSFGERRPFRPW